MKKQLLLLFLMGFLVLPVSLFGQEEAPMATMKVPYRNIIISEWARGIGNYIEISNVGDSTVNMEDFILWGTLYPWINWIGLMDRDSLGNLLDIRFNATPIPGGSGPTWRHSGEWHFRPDSHLLKPGESWVTHTVFDGANPQDTSVLHNLNLFEVADYHIHRNESAVDTTIAMSSFPEYENYPFDSVDNNVNSKLAKRTGWNIHDLGGRGRIFFFQNLKEKMGGPGDSALIDRVSPLANAQGQGPRQAYPVAGVAGASNDYGFARKATVTQGNLNWDLSAGTNFENSEWMLIPFLHQNRYQTGGRDKIFTSIGVHGDFKVEVTSDRGITFNEAAGTMSVPWGINKGDSLINYMTLGPGIVWTIEENGSEEIEDILKQGHTIYQNGDTLILMATGNELDSMIYTISVQEPADNETRVFERRIPVYNPVFDESGERLSPYFINNPPYEVVPMFGAAIDSITDIPFATRVDTVFKFLEKAPKANWDIIWVDGKERPDVKFGDILRVTAENGNDTRDYFLSVEDFTPSENANLAAITWPDKPGFLLGWTQDTIPKFTPSSYNYSISLPYQMKDVPALQVMTQNLNASVEMTPAVSLQGTAENTTTVITVTAEDGKTKATYRVNFTRELPPNLLQPWIAEPFLSEFSWRLPYNPDLMFEIYNPGTEPLDLSNYMIVRASTNFVDHFLGTAYNVRHAYIPGMKMPVDSLWAQNPGVYEFDPAVDPIVEPGETFNLLSIGNGGPSKGEGDGHPVEQIADVIFLHWQWNESNPYRAPDGNQWGWTRGDEFTGFFGEIPVNGNRYAIFKILNDSVNRSLKPVRDIDDFELIELFGYTDEGVLQINGEEITGSGGDLNVFRRKSHIYEPNPEVLGSISDDPDSCEWDLFRLGFTYNGQEFTNEISWQNFGTHYMDPVTPYISTIYSYKYSVDDGYEGDLEIRGVSGAEDVTEFLENILKEDEGQTLEVKTAVDGTVKNGTDPILATDVLVVTSGDGKNTTTYSISVDPLDDNNTLTLASGSELTLARDGASGTVSGFEPGTTIADVLAGLEVPTLASLSIMNTAGELVPLKYLNMDTVYVNTLATGDIIFEVKAQNGDVAEYSLAPTTLASSAYVLSNVYMVDEANSIISVIRGGTAVSGLMANLMPAPGATLQIYNKVGMPREFGTLAYDDYLIVTSEDGTVSIAYALNFIGEGAEGEVRGPAPDPTNLVLVDISATGEVSLKWDYESGLEFGFVIVRDGAVIDTVMAPEFSEEVTLGDTYNYSVYAYNEFGNTNSVDLAVLAWPTSTAMHDAEISIYPSVTQDWVYFKNLPAESQVVVVDLTGRTVVVRNSADLNNGLSLEAYENGYYLIKVMWDRENVKMVKVIKQ